MAQGLGNRIREGAKTTEGKVIAAILAICIVLVAWNVVAISWGVKGDVTTHIRYDANGGRGAVVTQEVAVDAESVLSKGEALSREGYTLVGWSLEPGEDNRAVFELGGTVTVDKVDEENNVLYAVWSKDA